MLALLEPDVAFRLMEVMCWMLIALGLLKLIIYIVGELLPGAYGKIKSDKVRNFMTGKANRWLFGFGGFLTALLGALFLILARILFNFLMQSAG